MVLSLYVAVLWTGDLSRVWHCVRICISSIKRSQLHFSEIPCTVSHCRMLNDITKGSIPWSAAQSPKFRKKLDLKWSRQFFVSFYYKLFFFTNCHFIDFYSSFPFDQFYFYSNLLNQYFVIYSSCLMPWLCEGLLEKMCLASKISIC